MGNLTIKRAYDTVQSVDGKRILVDRIWPRGIKKEKLQLDLWAKQIAPTKELRQEFNHEPEKFQWFTKQYLEELAENSYTSEFVTTIKKWLENQNVTLIYSAKNPQYNQAQVLLEFLQEQLKK
nr:DUF488 family protein [Enterococcus sp. DIV2402]MBO0463592.1 DUF488 family protein [Enterococcus sp. DIV2402]